MLKLELGRLKHDVGHCLPLDIEAACDPTAYGYDHMSLNEPLVLQGRAENIAGEIHVTGQLSAGLALNCSRCGEVFPFQLILPFKETYSSQAVSPDENGEQDHHSFSGSGIDLTPEALRSLFEKLPMKPLCHEDCKGLCPVCGLDLNREQCSCERKEIDPRFEKLRELL